ncbi:hypothetical protein EYF80_000906 [Liparis tanakae]|uniref:Uncharacterized protein n=1 Tax=Liparis tanakae TaxID=230148 RepID=A0A4Z2JGF6_9TELE|nr:hypothetical protein EYF80_000906 [Liparis tanakae]
MRALGFLQLRPGLAEADVPSISWRRVAAGSGLLQVLFRLRIPRLQSLLHWDQELQDDQPPLTAVYTVDDVMKRRNMTLGEPVVIAHLKPFRNMYALDSKCEENNLYQRHRWRKDTD